MTEHEQSVQYINEYIARARAAQAEFEKMTQEQVDLAVKTIGKVVYENAEYLAKLAVEETRMGNVEDKIAKNKQKAGIVWNNLRGKKSRGILDTDEKTGITRVAKPVGVVAAITPCTNPIVTPMSNAMFALKCGNAIIYGHNMKDGSMFAALLNYADDTFWEEHPTIRFDTLEETGTYQVLAAFYIDVSLSEDGVAFPFYEYTGLRDEAIFQEYLAQVGDRALYSTGVTAEFGEQLLTLSTCSYNTSDERFVVVAKQVV